jgi:type IV pilus assembly protein PilW
MKIKNCFSSEGFTLSELLVALAISGIVMASVYSTYYSQQKSYVAQDQVAIMQQNLRAALYYMEREIRMAGYDPTGTADASIVSAAADSINFTLDLTNNAGTGDPDGDTGDPNENITYSLYDSGGDGDDDLGRNTGGGNQPVAENIDALNFVYLDEDGNVTSTISDIRSVQISIVARTGRGDPEYVDASAYHNQQGTEILAAQNDNFRRRCIVLQVKCRNLGLL